MRKRKNNYFINTSKGFYMSSDEYGVFEKAYLFTNLYQRLEWLKEQLEDTEITFSNIKASNIYPSSNAVRIALYFQKISQPLEPSQPTKYEVLKIAIEETNDRLYFQQKVITPINNIKDPIRKKFFLIDFKHSLNEGRYFTKKQWIEEVEKLIKKLKNNDNPVLSLPKKVVSILDKQQDWITQKSMCYLVRRIKLTNNPRTNEPLISNNNREISMILKRDFPKICTSSIATIKRELEKQETPKRSHKVKINKIINDLENEIEKIE